MECGFLVGPGGLRGAVRARRHRAGHQGLPGAGGRDHRAGVVTAGPSRLAAPVSWEISHREVFDAWRIVARFGAMKISLRLTLLLLGGGALALRAADAPMAGDYETGGVGRLGSDTLPPPGHDPPKPKAPPPPRAAPIPGKNKAPHPPKGEGGESARA